MEIWYPEVEFYNISDHPLPKAMFSTMQSVSFTIICLITKHVWRKSVFHGKTLRLKKELLEANAMQREGDWG